jgi:hypothetical protein
MEHIQGSWFADASILMSRARSDPCYFKVANTIQDTIRRESPNHYNTADCFISCIYWRVTNRYWFIV